MTKDFALAGLRLGYLVGDSTLIQQIKLSLPPWTINTIAQSAGVAALTDRDYLHRAFQRLETDRAAFFAELLKIKERLVPSHTHYCLILVGEAKKVWLALLAEHLLVRDCTSFGLPEYIRVATRTYPDNQKLDSVLKR